MYWKQLQIIWQNEYSILPWNFVVIVRISVRSTMVTHFFRFQIELLFSHSSFFIRVQIFVSNRGFFTIRFWWWILATLVRWILWMDFFFFVKLSKDFAHILGLLISRHKELVKILWIVGSKRLGDFFSEFIELILIKISNVGVVWVLFLNLLFQILFFLG
jgi:hypothetical protein